MFFLAHPSLALGRVKTEKVDSPCLPPFLLSLSLYLSLSSSLYFCWPGHVFSSLWSNVSKVKSLKDCSLKVFSKCHCLCLCLCICLCRCVFVGQVMFLHDPHQFCKVLIWSGRLKVFAQIHSHPALVVESICHDISRCCGSPGSCGILEWMLMVEMSKKMLVKDYTRIVLCRVRKRKKISM